MVCMGAALKNLFHIAVDLVQDIVLITVYPSPVTLSPLLLPIESPTIGASVTTSTPNVCLE